MGKENSGVPRIEAEGYNQPTGIKFDLIFPEDPAELIQIKVGSISSDIEQLFSTECSHCPAVVTMK